MGVRYAFFDSPFGRCAIAWSDRGIVALQLPEKSEAQTRKKLMLRAVEAELASPPADVQRAIDDVVSHMEGEAVTLAHALDYDGLSVHARDTYEAARRIPVGDTRTDFDARAHRVLKKNPLAVLVPAHRALDKRGRLADADNGSVPHRMRLLVSEAQHQPRHFEGDGTLGFDPQVAIDRLRTDRQMARLIDRVTEHFGPFSMSVRRTPSIFAALAESIVYQQLSGYAAISIWSRVRALFPHGHVGPTPQQVVRATDAQLRSAGLSQNKMLALRDLARRAPTLPTLTEARTLDDETLVSRLTEVRGIGRWTVEMLLMFRLGRPDLLPVDDLGVRKGLSIMQGKRTMPTPKELLKRGERWRPYRTAASWYLWRACDLPAR